MWRGQGAIHEGAVSVTIESGILEIPVLRKVHQAWRQGWSGEVEACNKLCTL